MKTIYSVLIIMIGLMTTVQAQKNAGTKIPNMGTTMNNNKDFKKNIVREAMEKKQSGTYFSSSTKTATVVTETGKTYTFTPMPEDKNMLEDGIVAYTNTSKDTLFLQNSSLGKLIKEVWDQDNKNAKKPTIVMVKSISAVVAARKPKQIVDKKYLKD